MSFYNHIVDFDSSHDAVAVMHDFFFYHVPAKPFKECDCELVKWLNQHCEGQWTCVFVIPEFHDIRDQLELFDDWEEFYYDTLPRVACVFRFYFEKLSDAMLFKLTWS